MTHPRSLITNLKFTYADQSKKLGGMLKYFEYRNDKDGHTHIPTLDENGKRAPRWVDHGLGNRHYQILANCEELATDNLKRNVGSRLMVVGPEVSLMHAIPEERRIAVLEELTEATMELWFERMDLPTPQYSYVVHESQPGDERPDGRMKQDSHTDSYLHTHVVIAPTVPGLVQEREGYRVYEKQIGWLHQAGRDALEAIWERELGVERYAELQTELADRDRYQRELDAQHHQQERQADRLALETALGLDPDSTVPPLAPDLDTDIEMELE